MVCRQGGRLPTRVKDVFGRVKVIANGGNIDNVVALEGGGSVEVKQVHRDKL